MSEMLSNADVAELIQQVQSGESRQEQVGTTKKKRVRVVDFSRPTRFSQEHLRRITRMHESFCRASATSVSTELHVATEFELINVVQMTWASAIAELPTGSLFGILKVDPGEEHALVACELPFLLDCLDRMLGGNGGASPPRPDLTEIELRLSQRLIEGLIKQLSIVWSEATETTFEVEGLDSQVANVQIAPASETVLTLTVEARLGRESSTFTVVLPHTAIQRSLERMTAVGFGDRQQTTHDSAPVLQAVLPVEVELQAEVGSLELTVDEALRLRPGDVLAFGPADGGVSLYGGETATHVCRLGRVGNLRAVEILNPIATGQ